MPMRLLQVAYQSWLTTYSQLLTQYLKKLPFDRLRACVTFIRTKI